MPFRVNLLLQKFFYRLHMQIKQLIKKAVDIGEKAFFPDLCLHCRDYALKKYFFCEICSNLFEYTNEPFLRGYYYPTITTFEYTGPVKTLVNELKKQNIPSLVKLAASFLVYRYLNLSMPLPDIIVPVSSNFGYEQNVCLAKEMSKIFKRPVKKLITKVQMGFFPSFFIVSKTALYKKRVLLITDVVDIKQLNDIYLILNKKGFVDIMTLALS